VGSYLAHGPKIYPKAHENPRVFSCNSGPIFLESFIQCPWGVGYHQGDCLHFPCWGIASFVVRGSGFSNFLLLYDLRFMTIASLFSWMCCKYPKSLCFVIILGEFDCCMLWCFVILMFLKLNLITDVGRTCWFSDRKS